MAEEIPNYPTAEIRSYKKITIGTVIVEYSNTGLSMRKDRRPGFISLTAEEMEGLRRFLNYEMEGAEKRHGDTCSRTPSARP